MALLLSALPLPRFSLTPSASLASSPAPFPESTSSHPTRSKAIAESPLASEGGASYKTASSITGTMSSTLPAWAAIDRSSTSPELLCSSMSPRGEALACGFADGTVGVFDVPRMRLLWGFATYFGAVMSLAWSPDSKVIVAGGQDDLVTMASAVHQKVLCWGEGHR